MIIQPVDSSVSRMRDKLGRHLQAGFAEFTGGPTVSVAAWPWDPGDTPRLVIHQDLDFSRSDDDAGPCLSVCRFLVMFVAGVPGGDSTGRLADWWSAYTLQPDIFDGITEDEWWDPREPIPVAERRGGFRIYPLGEGPSIAAQTTVRTEIHNTERAD